MFAAAVASSNAKRQYFGFDGSLTAQRELVFKFLGQLADQKVLRNVLLKFQMVSINILVFNRFNSYLAYLKITLSSSTSFIFFKSLFMCRGEKRLPQVLQNKGETTFLSKFVHFLKL